MSKTFKNFLPVLFLSLSMGSGIYADGNENMKWQVYEKQLETTSLKFTVFHMENENPDNVVYFFHGAGGDHLTWIENGKRIRESWINSSIKPPVVVSVSFGEKWNLTPEHSEISSYLHLMKSEVFQFVETELGPFKQISGIGVSMGGFNLLQAVIDNPDFFDKILLISPAVADLNPYPSEKELIKYVQNSNSLTLKQKIKAFLTGKTPTENIERILYYWKLLVPDNKQWDDINPFIQLPKKNRLPGEIIITCGLNDAYGFFDGSKKLYKLFKEKSLDTQLFPIKDEAHLIMPPDEVLTFTDNY